MFSYLKTDMENIERIKQGRENINKGITATFFVIFIWSIITLLIYWYGTYMMDDIMNLFVLTFLIILYIGLVIKREL